MPASHSRRCTNIVALRNQRVAPDVVEVEMRVDDEVDRAEIAVDRFEPRAHLLTGLKVDPKPPGESGAELPGGVALAVEVQPGVEWRPALGMTLALPRTILRRFQYGD